MPFTHTNITDGLENIGFRFNGASDLEFRAATKPLELEQSNLSYLRIPPGYRFQYAHTRVAQEEVSSRSWPPVPPTSARIRAETWMAGETGGLTRSDTRRCAGDD